ncbi:MAG: tRNA pseudouridine(13) synthase TruD [Ignisphaera sp.]
MDVRSILTEEILDIALGIHVYTYPKIDEKTIDARIPRPHGFRVYEIVNEIDLESIDLDRPGEFDLDCRGNDNRYVYVVEKMNCDSHTLCKLMQKILRCKSCEILGLKEAEAISRQAVILRGCSKLIKIMRLQYGKRYIKAILWQCAPNLVLHNGNKFRIRIITKDLNTVRERLRFVHDYGYIFLNFFGYQRFGTRRPVTHFLGKLIIKNELDSFMDTLCNSRIHRLIKKAPEKIVCKNWLNHGNALKLVKRIPKDYILLYINAYQAYLFNSMLSKLWLKLLEIYRFEDAIKIMISEYTYLPIVGTKYYVHQRLVKEVLDEILSVEGINPSHFYVKTLAIEVKGDMRQALAQAQNVKTYFSCKDIELSFTLDRGCYATSFIRELLRTDPLNYT